MACTTILVGKKASNDGSTMIARNDDGFYDVKKLVVIDPKKQSRKYKSVISHVEIELPEDGLSYTCSPNVDKKEGVWAAAGINEENIGMTATETITSNARTLGADPLVKYKKAKSKNWRRRSCCSSTPIYSFCKRRCHSFSITDRKIWDL